MELLPLALYLTLGQSIVPVLGQGWAPQRLEEETNRRKAPTVSVVVKKLLVKQTLAVLK